MLYQIILSRFEIDDAVMLGNKLTRYSVNIAQDFIVKTIPIRCDDIVLTDLNCELEDQFRDIILEVMENRFDRFADDRRDIIHALAVNIVSEVIIHRLTHQVGACDALFS